MKKQFVTYDLALKLKELGFNEECFGVWFLFQNKPKIEYRLTSKTDKYKEGVFLAPTWQQAFDWMSTEFGIHGNVFPNGKNGEYQSFEYKKGYGGTATNAKVYSDIFLCRIDLLTHLIENK